MDWFLCDNGLRQKKVNPIQDEPRRGCSRMGGGRQKGPPSLKSVIPILQW